MPVCIPGAICGDLQDSGPVGVAEETKELQLSEEEPAGPLPQLTQPQSCWQEAGCRGPLGAKVGGHRTGSGCGRLKQLPATKVSGKKTSPEYYSSIRQAVSTCPLFLVDRTYKHFGVGWDLKADAFYWFGLSC